MTGRARTAGELFLRDLVGVGAVERRTAGKELEEHDTERVHVGARGGPLPLDLFGAEVGSDGGGASGAGVTAPPAAPVPAPTLHLVRPDGQQQIRRLQVAMDQADRLQGGHGGRRLPRIPRGQWDG